MKNKYFAVANGDDMASLGALFAQKAQSPLIFFLYGYIGSGKTTFAKGFISECGFSDTIKSPTYTLVETYISETWHICHFDFFRLTDKSEFEAIGGRDYFNDNSICLIEWPERVAGNVPPADLCLYFTYQETGRMIRIQVNNETGKSLLQKVIQ